MARVRNGTSEYVKLEQRLILLACLNGHFGYKNNCDLLPDMKESAEGLFSSFAHGRGLPPSAPRFRWASLCHENGSWFTAVTLCLSAEALA